MLDGLVDKASVIFWMGGGLYHMNTLSLQACKYHLSDYLKSGEYNCKILVLWENQPNSTKVVKKVWTQI